jgi:hypothetical protein
MRTPLLLFLPILFASCSRYQYATISSSNMNLSNNHEFVAENDTLRLVYNFSGRNAPVRLVIENKLNVPVYVDWRQSALIVNDKAISYVPNEVPIIGALNTAGIKWDAVNSSSSGTLNAVATLPASLDFIPPHSRIAKNPMGVTNRAIKSIPDSAVKKIQIPTEEGSFWAKQSTFTEASSPMRFRSYLTISVGEAGAKPQALEHGFYISELVTTGLGPESFGYIQRNEGNRYYIKETTGFGKAATGFGVIAGTAVVYGAAAALNPNNGNCNNCGNY